jgi:hypothetical protein
MEGIPDAAASIRQSVLEVFKLAAAIAAQFHQDHERAIAAVSAAILSRDRGSACVLWAQEEVEKIANVEDPRMGANQNRRASGDPGQRGTE